MEAVPYTIFRLGPSYFTERYPIDDTCISKEILNDNGVIGPKYYVEMGVIDSLKNYDNDFFVRSRNEELHEHFKSDLLVLAEKYYNSSAYTLLASISDENVEQKKYMLLAAESGNLAGMVAYGQLLILEGERETGVRWILRGAEGGQEMGQLFIAISYHYGTITPLDYDKAAYWYRRVIKEKKNFFAANNLGTFYMEAGYYRTALKFFKKAVEYHTDELREEDAYIDNDRLNDMLSNVDSCKKILKSPLRLRPMMFTLQVHDSKLEALFCCIWDQGGRHVAPPPVFDSTSERIPNWEPKDKQDIKRETLVRKIVLFSEQVKYCFCKSNAKAALGDDMNESLSTDLSLKEEYLFLSVEVEIKTRLFVPNQHEMIFFERRAHGKLNQFISRNLMRLDRRFRNHGFFFTYLPAMARRSDTSDIIGYYVADIECLSNFWERIEEKRTKDIFLYWEQLKETTLLPPDCAGFLHYNPHRSITTGNLIFDYIMIPVLPETNFEMMFDAFISQLDKVSFDRLQPARLEYREIDLLIPTNRLEISSEYNITLVRPNGDRVEVKMPVLSRVLFIVFLKYPEGIVLKRLSERRKELLDLYEDISHRDINEDSINSLVDPTSNSVNEKISRIRRAFVDALGENANEVDLYVPKGSPGKVYRIMIPRSSVVFI